jgi:hypothetical protein
MKMPNAFLVHDEDCKQHVVMVSRIKGVEHVPGTAGEAAVEAQDAVADDPGVPATATSPGRAPVPGHPKLEAKPAILAVPDSCIIKTEDGDIKCGLTVQQVMAQIG